MEFPCFVVAYPAALAILLQRTDAARLDIKLIGDGDGTQHAPGSPVVAGLFQKDVLAALDGLFVLAFRIFRGC